MNDPFECLAFVKRSFVRQEIDQFKQRYTASTSNVLRSLANSREEDFLGYFNRVREQALRNWVFCSLSEVPDDILMWSHYANGHKGMVIAFEFSPEKQAKFRKVKYVDKLPEFSLVNFGEFMEGNDEHGSIILDDLSIKSVEWEREREWRIWGKKPGYYRYDRTEIKEVYFGINCEFEIIVLIRKLLGEDIKYYEMEFRDDPLRLVKQ